MRRQNNSDSEIVQKVTPITPYNPEPMILITACRQVTGCLLMLFLFLLPSMVSAADLTVALLPRYSLDIMSTRTRLLADYLSEKLQTRVVPVVTRDFDDFRNRVRNGEILIGLEDPMMYVSISDVHEAVAVVEKDGMTRLRGVIIVRKDSPIESTDELEGKVISIAGKNSAAGFLSQKITLQEEDDLLPGRDYKVVTAADNKHENVILAVYTGDADAGFVRRISLKQVSQFIPTGQLRVLKATAWLPNWALSVNSSLPDELKKNIADAVVGMTRDDKVAVSFKINGFSTADDNTYAPIRAALEN